MDSIFHKDRPTKHENPSKHHSEHSDGQHDKHHQPSKGEILSSAKVVAEAAKSKFKKDSDNVDKTKFAHATGDLLSAASHYGKLDQKSYGKYVGKAEDYLHNYNNSHPTKNSNHHSDHSDAAGKPSASHSGHSGSDTKPGSHSSSPPSGGHGHGHSGSGYGNYLKMAEGYLKKH